MFRTDSRGIINTAGQLVHCSWATSSCSSLVTGSVSGRSVSPKTLYFLMYLGEQLLHRQTFNPSNTAMFYFLNIYHHDITKYKNAIAKQVFTKQVLTSIQIYIEVNCGSTKTFFQTLFLDLYMTLVVQEYSKLLFKGYVR